ncbi:ASCH domain-containing protein [Gordonia sp. PP30]|uniref:ASCH domain-containing protein n=1 Tax=Gordonia sp. PP30 TaxID=2935861 RepID=UPI001FFFE883|nr:ASCH domain-containing protein [Gordonia sp. PP30]UQE76275.1 ASCH domain-containing protein [Gordonia sp. PP30]
MLISKAIAEQIRAGTVTAQYRRWDVPRVKVGGTQLTPAGVVRFTRVARVNDLDRLTDRAARAAGMKNADALRKALAPRPNRAPSERGSRGGEHIYRINLEWAGEDPRLALREELPDAAACAEIARRTAVLDRRLGDGWTRETLEWIDANPRVVSKRLAELRGVELAPMKTDIRKLKSLGLTISHDVGYELSPRGAAYLAWLRR